MISEDRVNALKDILEEDSFLSITSNQYEKSRIGNYNMLQFELALIFDDIVWTMNTDSGIASALHFALALYTRIPDRPWGFERYWSDNSAYIWAVQFDGEYLKCRHQPIIEEVWWCSECDKDNWGNSSEHQKDI